MNPQCPFNEESVAQLKLFINLVKKQPELLHVQELNFFKEFIETLGGHIPEPAPSAEMPKNDIPKEQEPPVEEPESDSESDLEIDMTGCVEPDKIEEQEMGDPDKEPTEEEQDKADEVRTKAAKEFNEGNFEKALEHYTEAIRINPQSALCFSKRGQVYLKLNRPNACIKDCTRALEINCDSAPAYKFRGRAYRLIAEWESSAQDLRQACIIDFDEQADEWLRDVNPNALKIEQHKLKQERKLQEKTEKEQKERLRKAREAHAKASAQGEEAPPTMGAGAGMGGGMGGAMPNFGAAGAGGIPGMGDFYKLLQDPDVMAAFQDPEIATALQDISTNPANFMKYQNNPKIQAVLEKLQNKVKGSGMGFPGFGGAFPGFGGTGGAAPTDDDGLD